MYISLLFIIQISILDQDVNRVKCYGYDDFANTSEVGYSEFKNEVKYGGMVEDESSGLHYMNARHYNPTSGRFLTEDMYNNPNSPDLYGYTGNNPINFVYPTGHNGVLTLGKEILSGIQIIGSATMLGLTLLGWGVVIIGSVAAGVTAALGINTTFPG